MSPRRAGRRPATARTTARASSPTTSRWRHQRQQRVVGSQRGLVTVLPAYGGDCRAAHPSKVRAGCASSARDSAVLAGCRPGPQRRRVEGTPVHRHAKAGRSRVRRLERPEVRQGPLRPDGHRHRADHPAGRAAVRPDGRPRPAEHLARSPACPPTTSPSRAPATGRSLSFADSAVTAGTVAAVGRGTGREPRRAAGDRHDQGRGGGTSAAVSAFGVEPGSPPRPGRRRDRRQHGGAVHARPPTTWACAPGDALTLAGQRLTVAAVQRATPPTATLPVIWTSLDDLADASRPPATGPAARPPPSRPAHHLRQPIRRPPTDAAGTKTVSHRATRCPRSAPTPPRTAPCS